MGESDKHEQEYAETIVKLQVASADAHTQRRLAQAAASEATRLREELVSELTVILCV